jgi:outer membrane protein insertion porin family
MLRFSLVLYFALVFQFSSIFPATAETMTTTTSQLNKRPIVDEIEILGLWRTKPSVVMRELLFSENDILTTRDLLTSVQRLKNLRIFSKVIPLLKLKPGNKVKLTLQLEEKWTTIPFFNISGGGGTTYAYGGVYDINTFGRFIETGARYDNWNGRHGGVVWMRNPRFFNQRLLFGADLWKTKRVRQLYASNSESQGHYVLDTKKINLIIKKELTPEFQVGVEVELNKNNIIDQETNSLTDNKTISQLNNNQEHTAIFNTAFVELGKLDYDNYLVEGKFSKFSVKHANQSLGSDISATQIDWFNRIFWRLPYKANAGLRFNFGWTNTKEIQYLYYIGGFNNVRGYLDGQFRSNTYWQANVEYRIPSYRSHWLVLQHIFFIDAAGTGSHLEDLKQNKMQYSSAGIGLRIISPRIYRFNGRIDFALFTSGESPSYISFGSQQYF